MLKRLEVSISAIGIGLMRVLGSSAFVLHIILFLLNGLGCEREYATPCFVHRLEKRV